MDQNEFSKLFGLGGYADIESKPPVSATPLSSQTSHDTCLQLDRWGKVRGQEMSERLDEPERTGGPDDWFPSACADFHAASFDLHPKLHDSCVDEKRHAFMKSLLESPDYQAMHKATRGNLVMSDIATLSLLKSFADICEKTESDEQQGQGAGEQSGQGGEMEMIASAAMAAEQAHQDVKDGSELSGFLAGNSKGQTSEANREQIAEMFKKFRNNEMLRSIINAAGAFRRHYHAVKSRKIVHGMDDVVGVKTSNTLEFMLPGEMVYLASPTLRYEFCRKLGNSEIRRFDCRATQKVGKGPVIAFCDSSGSMKERDNHIQARGLCMTLAWVARAQNRPFVMVNFDYGLNGMATDKSSDAEMFDFLCDHIGGGTSFEFLCQDTIESLRHGMDLSKTDVIVITDGHGSLSRQDEFNRWRKSIGMKVHSIVIGNNQGHPLADVSDEVTYTTQLGIEDATQALSI